MMLWENNDIFHDNPLLLTEQRDHQTIGVAHPTQQFDVNVNVLCHASSNQTARCIPEYQGEFVLRSAASLPTPSQQYDASIDRINRSTDREIWASRPVTGGERLAGSRHTPGGSAYSSIQSAAVGALPPWSRSDLVLPERSFIRQWVIDFLAVAVAVVFVMSASVAVSVSLFILLFVSL